jgi:acyl carrier protein
VGLTVTSSLERLCGVVAGALRVPQEQVTPASSSENLEAWNSLGHLDVILHVERAFSARFKSAEMPTLNSIDALARRLGLSDVN